jgi:hypothetical protein
MTTRRISIPVSDRIRAEVAERPEQLGLDPALPEAQLYAQLVEEGMRARAARERDRRRAEAYAEHDADPESAEALELADALAFRDDGGF